MASKPGVNSRLHLKPKWIWKPLIISNLAESGKKFDVSPIVRSKWKSDRLGKLQGIIDRPGFSSDEGETVYWEKLSVQIGQLKWRRTY
jgi:hypothetical protein